MAPAFLEYCYSFITIGLVWYTLSYSLRPHQSIKKIFRAWFLFGLVFGMFAFLLPYTAYPIPWLAPGGIQILGLFLFNVIVGLMCAVAYSFVAVSLYIQKSISTTWWIKVLIFAVSLSIAEILRSLLLSLLFYGNGGTIGLHWTGETIGNALSVTPFIEYAYFGGSYMLTFLVGIFVYTGIVSTQNRKMFVYYLPYILATVLLLCIHFLIPVRLPEKPTTVAVVSTTFTFPDEKERYQIMAKNYVDTYRTTLALSPYKPDIIVYPEDAEFTRLLLDGRDTEMQKFFPDTLIVDGSTMKVNNKLSNATVYYNTTIKSKSYAYKRFMFPLNEYIPYAFMFIFEHFINPQALSTFKEDHGYTPIFESRSYLHSGIRVATLLCSEIVSFETVRAVGSEKPDIIFHQAQLVVFRGSVIYGSHLRSFSKVAAAQLRTTVIGSINEMPSYIISPYGKIVGEVYSKNKNEVATSIFRVSKDGVTNITNPN